MHLNASSIALIIAPLTSGYACSNDATPIDAGHLNHKYAATLATAVKMVLGIPLPEYKPGKFPFFVTKLSYGS
jgi:hypothetical protein